MRAKTEELLYMLLWGADVLMRPTRLNFESSFEQWAFRSGLGRRVQFLEKQKWIEAENGVLPGKRLARLTEAGRLAALGGVDPVKAWARSWDGVWRLVFFDVPEQENRTRVKLRRSLRQLKFGYLQNSVWVSPDSFARLEIKFKGLATNVESLTLFEGKPAGGESDQDIVSGAWSFRTINLLYTQWKLVAEALPPVKNGSEAEWSALRAWAARERAAWNDVIEVDPFLPAALLPSGYMGRKCWETRMRIFQSLGRGLMA